VPGCRLNGFRSKHGRAPIGRRRPPLTVFEDKASKLIVPLFNIQVFFAVLHRQMTYAVGVPVLLASTMLYPVGKLSKNLQSIRHLAGGVRTLTQPYQ